METIMLLKQLRCSIAIMKKNVRIYYSKGPVVIFGLLFPLFLFLAYTIGRNLSPEALLPGLIGMTTFFTSTSVGPAIVPWETRSRTLERLISSPIMVWTIFLGDMLSSFIFGAVVSLFPIIVAFIWGVRIMDALTLIFGVVLASFCFASLSILLSAYPPTDLPATVMMVSSMVKFPLVFISGVFIPLKELPEWGRAIAIVSPLTYFTDLARHTIHGNGYYPPILDIIALVIFTILFLTTAIKLHEKTLPRRLT